jgi:hypothetical protein
MKFAQSCWIFLLLSLCITSAPSSAWANGEQDAEIIYKILMGNEHLTTHAQSIQKSSSYSKFTDSVLEFEKFLRAIAKLPESQSIEGTSCTPQHSAVSALRSLRTLHPDALEKIAFIYG